MWFIIFFLIPYTGMPVSACGIVFTPEKVVVGFGSRLVANCSSSPSCDNMEGMGWESAYGGTGLIKGVYTLPFNIDKVKAWEIEPQCYISFSDHSDQIDEILPVTVYQMPKNVSISDSSERGIFQEGKNYSIQCDVRNVAPAGHLSVLWHKGKKMIRKKTFKEASISPVNVSSVFYLNPRRDDHGSEIWCEAKLDLWPEGQGPPAIQSQSLKLTVLSLPAFIHPENETQELSTNSRLIFNCAATGNPKPDYSWRVAHSTQQEMQTENSSTLTPDLQLAGIYSCTASNQQGSKTKYFIVTEAEGNPTTLAAILGVFLALGAVIFVVGVIFVTPNGTFSFKKEPPSSGII